MTGFERSREGLLLPIPIGARRSGRRFAACDPSSHEGCPNMSSTSRGFFVLHRPLPSLLRTSGSARTAMEQTGPVRIDPLMARLAEGDRAAFSPLFELLWPSMLRLCARLLQNDADAADAAQQAMEKVLTRASDYDPARPALPWALAIASWECRTIQRKRSRRKEVAGEASLLPLPDPAVPDLEQRDLERAAFEAMGTLSDVDRETLVSTYFDEAASASGATLRKRRERALGRLRDAFKRLYGLD